MKCSFTGEIFMHLFIMKMNIEFFLLGFALTTIMWCVMFGFVIAKISKDCEQKIEQFKKK